MVDCPTCWGTGRAKLAADIECECAACDGTGACVDQTCDEDGCPLSPEVVFHGGPKRGKRCTAHAGDSEVHYHGWRFVDCYSADCPDWKKG